MVIFTVLLKFKQQPANLYMQLTFVRATKILLYLFVQWFVVCTIKWFDSSSSNFLITTDILSLVSSKIKIRVLIQLVSAYFSSRKIRDHIFTATLRNPISGELISELTIFCLLFWPIFMINNSATTCFESIPNNVTAQNEIWLVASCHLYCVMVVSADVNGESIHKGMCVVERKRELFPAACTDDLQWLGKRWTRLYCTITNMLFSVPSLFCMVEKRSAPALTCDLYPVMFVIGGIMPGNTMNEYFGAF